MRAAGGRLWPWLPLLIGAAYLIVLLASFRSVVQSFYQQADFASAVYIGELYPQAPSGAEVVLTNFPWYTTLWIERLTGWLPAHRQIWQVAPWIGSLGGVGVLAWSTWRAAGTWAAAMTAVVLACAGPGLLVTQLPAGGHAYTYVHVCILGAFLVWLAGRPEARLGAPVTAAASVLVVLVTAAGLASDQLLLVAGIAPFLVAGLVLSRRLAAPAARRLAATTTLVATASLAGGIAIRAIMEGRHVVARDFEVTFAAFDRIAPNVRLLLHSIAHLFNGDFGGAPIDARGLLTAACAAVVAAAGVVAVRMGRSWWDGAAARPPAPLALGSSEAARAAHVTFWLLAAAIVAAGFVLSNQPVDRYSSRYVVTAAYGLAALVPVAAAARGTAARIVVVAGVSLIVAGSLRSVAARDVQEGLAAYPSGSQSGPLLRLAQREDVRYGYAGYWVAAPLSWQMKTKVQLYPVQPCPASTGTLCPVDLHHISSWYTPRPGTRTILVVDPVFHERGPVDAPASLGPPERTVKVDRLVVHLYGYDIASRFGDT